MKQFLQTILLFAICAAFFVMGTATSQDIDFENYDATVELSGANIVLTSASNQPISNANLRLNSADSTNVYFLQEYDLAVSTSDTIPMADFVTTSGVAFADSLPPVSFQMDFVNSDTSFFFSHNF